MSKQKTNQHHWFYLAEKSQSTQKYLKPFSQKDSDKLEEAYLDSKDSIDYLRNIMNASSDICSSGSFSSPYIVPVRSGRYDVDLVTGEMRPAYWKSPEEKCEVRRCLWFYLTEKRSFESLGHEYWPFLEAQITSTIKQNEMKLITSPFNPNEAFKLTPKENFYFYKDSEKYRLVKGFDKLKKLLGSEYLSEIEHVEHEYNCKHLFLVVHGIGESCELPIRPILDCANSFKKMSIDVLNANKNDKAKNKESIEFIPITWNDLLGHDSKNWKKISLSSLNSLRKYSNTALSDIFLYCDAVGRNNIMKKVAHDLNKVHNMFRERNPTFNGTVNLIGHSLGSLIIFDLISNLEFNDGVLTDKPKLDFKVNSFFAIGSPIGYFLNIRGIHAFNGDFKLNCERFYNIFHQLDPVAYRLEPFINPDTVLEPKIVSSYKKSSIWHHHHNKKNRNSLDGEMSFEYNYQRICHSTKIYGRVDFALEKSKMEVINDYMFLFKAHSSYWDSYDLIHFMVKCLEPDSG